LPLARLLPLLLVLRTRAGILFFFFLYLFSLAPRRELPFGEVAFFVFNPCPLEGSPMVGEGEEKKTKITAFGPRSCKNKN
jgi:hypothetical protein